MQIKNSYRDIVRLALPISLAQLIPQINFFANTAFLGRVGERELGINGIAGVFYLTLSMIGYGLSNGLQVQMSRRAGEGDREGLSRTFINGVMLSVVLSLLMMMLSMWLAPIIFALSLHDATNVYLSIDFLYLRIWGLPVLMLTQMVYAYFIANGKTSMLVIGAGVAALFNIVFDYLLIFGWGPFSPMGLDGAALASVIAEVAGFIIMALLLFSKKGWILLPYLRKLQFVPAEAFKSLKIAAPLIVQFLFSIGGWQLFFIWIEHLGKAELAASQILRSVIGLVGIGCWALASTCNMMVSNLIGQGRQEEVLNAVGKVTKVSVLYALVLCTLLIIFGEEFLLLYRNDRDFAAYALPAMRVVTLTAFLMAPATVVFNAVVGTGNTKVNLIMEISCVSLYILYCYIVIEWKRMSLAWAWGSDFIYWSTLIIFSTSYLLWGRWRNKEV